ncbi:MAG TPA: heavy metal translocating P-type ATPase [Xylanibacter oryzae]|nr:heavy metal translocating P-type ATPase [Xylanibacter oryzae]
MEKKTIAVLGMACAGCATNVEKKLNSLQGVKSAAVNFAARTALIEYDDKVITPQTMKDEVIKIGYDLVIEEGRSVVEIEKNAYRNLRRKVVVSWIFAILTMSLSMGWINIGNDILSSQTMMLLALLNIIYCGRQFYVNAWKQLLHGMANMDTLVALSTGVAFIFSIFSTMHYYDASVMIITFVLTGRLMEERAKDGTASAIRALMGLAPKTALLVDGDNVSEVPISTLKPGDVIEIHQGNKVPVDGTIIKGDIYVDESMISGEPVPVSKNPGDKLMTGTMVKQGKARFRAEEVGSKTMLAHIIKMVQEAQGSKAPVQRVVDKVAMIFVPSILAISIVTFIVWWIIGGTAMLPHAITSAVSVLVIACPCAMGLATPTALMVGIGKAAQKNILIKDATALENIRKVDAMVIDKTGTLTEPNKDVDFTQSGSLTLEERETLKPYAREAMDNLQRQGIDVYMMSGDKDEAARYWAEKAGIKHYQSKVMPQDKENLVRKLQAGGKHVAMVGDGINDSQALAAADVSIAMGKGTDIAMDVAQVTLMGSDLRRIPDAILLSRKTTRMIYENLFWAFIYNIICIPLAAGVLYKVCDFQITPMWASALMAMSSVSVVLNSLRLKLVA